MDNGRELIDALTMVAKEKGIDKEIIFEAIEASLVSACKKHFGPTANIRVVVDRETGEYIVLASKTVCEKVEDDLAEITLEDARKINVQYEIDDVVEVKVKPGNFGRISAQTAKQVVVQKFREAERELIFNEYIDKQNQVVTGIVQRRDRRNVYVSLGRIEAFLPIAEQMPREAYHFNDRIRVYVLEVKQTSKGPAVNVSRTHPELLKYLFEQEIPEVADGTVEVKAVVREAGNRSKVAVSTQVPHIDPIGACVGQNGQRVHVISTELKGEKLDIVQWSDDPIKYITSALSPSKVIEVAVNKAEQVAHVVVPDGQLSLAIGKEGQNARLAARLTGWRIDIKSESQAAGTDFLVFENVKKESPTEANIEARAEIEESYAHFYDTEEDAKAAEQEPSEASSSNEQGEYYDEEYYDEEYYDEEYYDEEYYDEEYYDEEYYEEYDEAPAKEE